MQKLFVIITLTISLGLSYWLYGQSDLKLKNMLEDSHWQSKSVVYTDWWKDKLPANKTTVVSIYKYLPNGTYLKSSTLSFNYNDSVHYQNAMELTFSETGTWDVSDHYLVIEPDSFTDNSTETLLNDKINIDQINKIKQLFKANSQQSQKIDIIHETTLLMGDLDNGSRLLNAIISD